MYKFLLKFISLFLSFKQRGKIESISDRLVIYVGYSYKNENLNE